MRLLRLALDISQTRVHSRVLQRNIIKYEDDAGGFIRGLFAQTDPAKREDRRIWIRVNRPRQEIEGHGPK